MTGKAWFGILGPLAAGVDGGSGWSLLGVSSVSCLRCC